MIDRCSSSSRIAEGLRRIAEAPRQSYRRIAGVQRLLAHCAIGRARPLAGPKVLVLIGARPLAGPKDCRGAATAHALAHCASGRARPLAGGRARPLAGGRARPLAGGRARPLAGGRTRPLAGGFGRAPVRARMRVNIPNPPHRVTAHAEAPSPHTSPNPPHRTRPPTPSPHTSPNPPPRTRPLDSAPVRSESVKKTPSL
jgi:hypothetical protein